MKQKKSGGKRDGQSLCWTLNVVWFNVVISFFLLLHCSTLHTVRVLHLANFRTSLYFRIKMHFLPLQKVKDFMGTPPHVNAAGALA